MHGPCGLDMDSLKQNRSNSCVCSHEARAHAAVGSKERSWWQRTEQKKFVLENVPPWGCGQGTGLPGRRGTETSGCQISTLGVGREGGALAGLRVQLRTPGALCLRPLHAQLARDRWGRRPWTFLVSPSQQKACKAFPGVKGFCQHSVLCSSSPSHLSLPLPIH